MLSNYITSPLTVKDIFNFYLERREKKKLIQMHLVIYKIFVSEIIFFTIVCRK